MSTTQTTQDDAQTRADDRARQGADAVEHRAILNSSTPVVSRRAAPDQTAPRAESRGIYLDADNVRRVVGAGQVIPDGWTRIEGATVEDRITDVTRAAHAGGQKSSSSTTHKPSVDDLRKRAGELGIDGRSSMKRAELEKAIADAEAKTAGSGEKAIADAEAKTAGSGV